jgi:hypothetical protein
MNHRAKLRCNVTSTLENQMRASVHATTAVLAIRLRLPQSFRENSQQLVGISSIKKALAHDPPKCERFGDQITRSLR